MKISVVATLYFSENYIDEFYSRTLAQVKRLTHDYEIIFVNDGSPDHSLEKVLTLQAIDPNIILIDLSKNFGHHPAILTGLRHTTGDYIFLIDADLEEEPELLGMFWEEMKNCPENDVVYGVQETRKGKIFEKKSGSLFYKFFKYLAGYEYPANTFTARLMTQRYVEGMKKFNEKEFDLWGLFILTGYKQKGLSVTKKSKGATTYTLMKKIRLAIISITSLTNRPLYIIFFLGLLITIVAFVSVVIIAIQKVFFNVDVEGWASVISSIWLIGGIIMFTLGIIGIYMSKIYMEVKNRPTSIIKKIYNRNEPK